MGSEVPVVLGRHCRSKTAQLLTAAGWEKLPGDCGPLPGPSLNILAHLASKIYSNVRPGPRAGDTDGCRVQKGLGTGSVNKEVPKVPTTGARLEPHLTDE